MTFPPDLTTALPAPRDDEPPELRSRIVKELRDHLECAYRRELVLTGNENEAARRVIARFGDPARLARKLWFDALREQIMSQRILIGLCSVMVAACLAMGGLAWRLSSQAMAATESLVAQSRDAHLGLLAVLQKLESRNAEPARPVDPEWVHLKAKLTKERKDGAPADGYRVTLIDRKQPPESGSIEVLAETSDATGTIDYGLMRSGKYSLRIETSWGEWTFEEFYLRAGQSEQTVAVACPGTPPPTVRCLPAIDWPTDLKENPLVGAMIQLGMSGGRTIEGSTWGQSGSQLDCVVKTDGSIVQIGPFAHLSHHQGVPYRSVNVSPQSLTTPPQALAEIRRTVIGGTHAFGLILFTDDADSRADLSVLLAVNTNGEWQPSTPIPDGMTEERPRIALPDELVARFREALKDAMNSNGE